ncbi:CPBP family intramembrane metalloprotease [Anaerobacillus sp. CMMVII]|uniref:CPBP family intramembrane glutamic endopeptidase n=1 Tax=Anaerobacillus sp. CMMVII TaxID=2755588 RepID=UPI0021B7C6C5|nr:CPBP family intramembrane glutamic endopeptidase [Anaerobacillus sp. CMMVII]MCT8138771.1 CPBP family intramembrane metalloprotease [Anaerobacillus sp. CMMVII]
MGQYNNFRGIKTWVLVLKTFVLFIVTFIVFAIIQLATGTDMNNLFNITIHILLIILFIHSLKKHNISIKQVLGNLSINSQPWLQLISIKVLLIIFSLLSVVAIFFIIGLVDSNFFKEMLIEDIEENLGIVGLNRIIVLFLLGITLVPIMEELLFRGYLLNKWGESIGVTKAVIFSSFLFGLLHLDTGFIAHFVSAIFYSFAYIKTKSLLVPIILHAFNNFVAGSIQFIPDTGLPLIYEDISQSIKEIQIVISIGTILFIILTPIVSYVLYRYIKGTPSVTPYQNNKAM